MPKPAIKPGWPDVLARAAVPGSPTLQTWVANHGPANNRHLNARGLALAKGLSQWQKSRSYAGAANTRTTSDWVTLSTSADAELYTGLRAMRNRCRQLCRDNEHARQALRLIVNNVVGQGIGLQAENLMGRGGKLDKRTNDSIESAWQRWGHPSRCHTAGKLSWAAIQRVVISGVAEAGEVLIRMITKPFGDSRVPFALEIIEADQLVDNWTGRAPNGNEVRMGVEVDTWMRPVGYWLYPMHPGDNMVQGVPQSNDYRFVPAAEIIHVGLFSRPHQTRCPPWFHAAMIKLRHMGGYEEAEIVAARASASIMGFRVKPEVDVPGDDGTDADDVQDGERVTDMSPGIIMDLGPGESFTGFNPTRPSSAIDPFMRHMLRSVAAGIGISYESLSRDYSQSNYSSSRLALLDDRDNWRVVQAWLLETLHQQVFDKWLEMAVLSGELQLPRYEQARESYQAVRWMPRGWDWVDPLKEVTAAKLSRRAGFQSSQDIISAKGGDFEDVYNQISIENAMAKDLGLVLDIDPAQVDDKGSIQTDPSADPAADPSADPNADASADPGTTKPTPSKADKTLQLAELQAREVQAIEALNKISDAIEALEHA